MIYKMSSTVLIHLNQHGINQRGHTSSNIVGLNIQFLWLATEVVHMIMIKVTLF